MKTLDPRMKLFFVIVITTLALLFSHPLWMLCLSVTALLIGFFMGADFNVFFRKLIRFTKVLFIIAAVQIIFVRTGDALVVIDGFALVYYDGLMRGLNTAMRYFVILYSAAVMAGENSRRVIASLTQMKVPYMFAFMVMITLRFLPIYAESFSDAMTSIQLRGVELKKVRFGRKIRLYGHLLLPVVADSIAKSQDLSAAMEARGFGAKKTRTAYHVIEMRKSDFLFFVVFSLLSAGAIAGYYLLQ
ncbi:MAG: Energy-coupling factor transporter transmembrane protein EcfT [Firmicutes bacterium ADurb.Bin182]|nr:MAG: Energy-coupling factor transporter transmembrane protein EcfT [Firmicutes bacterium ADurb.Bin182]